MRHLAELAFMWSKSGQKRDSMNLGHHFLEIEAILRPMRGPSRSWLVRASDGWLYVAKFEGNPMGNRSLISQHIAEQILATLGVSTPGTAILRVSRTCEGLGKLQINHALKYALDGLHFGSRLPVNPDEAATWDFLPRKLYPLVTNLSQIGVVFAFDTWTRHIGNRQFLFTRESGAGGTFRLWAIDHKCLGSDWLELPQLRDHRYSANFIISGSSDYQSAALRGSNLIVDLPLSYLEAAFESVPRRWFATPDEQILLWNVIRSLHGRQSGVTDEVRRALDQ
jgi:hypothetical protein